MGQFLMDVFFGAARFDDPGGNQYFGPGFFGFGEVDRSQKTGRVGVVAVVQDGQPLFSPADFESGFK